MKQMAIIKSVEFGVRDRNHAMLSFSVYLSEGEAALICIPGDKALQLINTHRVVDVRHLEGKPCWVETDGVSSVKFVDLAKI